MPTLTVDVRVNNMTELDMSDDTAAGSQSHTSSLKQGVHIFTIGTVDGPSSEILPVPVCVIERVTGGNQSPRGDPFVLRRASLDRAIQVRIP